jgi:hypothetical protein
MILENDNDVPEPDTDYVYFRLGSTHYPDDRTRPNDGISHYTVKQLREWVNSSWVDGTFVCVAREPITPNDQALIDYWRQL